MDARGAEERKMDAGEAGEREMEVEPRLASGRSRMLVEHRLSGAHFASLDACARAPAEVLGQPGRSGYPNQSGRVIRVIESSGNTIFNPKSDPKLHYPQPRVPTDSGSGSGLPVLPEKIK
jgi:hypothetical protein